MRDLVHVNKHNTLKKQAEKGEDGMRWNCIFTFVKWEGENILLKKSIARKGGNQEMVCSMSVSKLLQLEYWIWIWQIGDKDLEN